MAKLSEAENRFIVQALACYDTPTQVVEAVKEEFGNRFIQGLHNRHIAERELCLSGLD
tara:strand:+ start:150 stop:323 length:174 start_codon:yes stop_codon:yes gene_type:complete